MVKRSDLFEAVKASIVDFNSTSHSQPPTFSSTNPEEVVIQFCENMCSVATGITLHQVMTHF